jgi:hypothetical protein
MIFPRFNRWCGPIAAHFEHEAVMTSHLPRARSSTSIRAADNPTSFNGARRLAFGADFHTGFTFM